jgi:tetratricopeptide (TPR) repeat protein
VKHSLALLAFTMGLAAAAPAQAQQSELPALQASAQSRAPEAQLRLGRALRRAGRFDEALSTLRAASRGPTRTEALWEIARVRIDQGDFRASQTACNALPAGRGPRDATGLMRRVCMARAHLVWQRAALAEREIDAARAIEPNHGELQLVIADAARLSGRLPAAEQAYRAAASALPGRAEPHLGLGLLFENAQRPDEALAAFQQATAADAHDPPSNLALGRFLLERRRDHAAALPLLRRAVEERPGWPEAMVALGHAHLATGASNDALAMFREVVQRAPSQPGAQAGIGRALVQLQQFAEAEAPLRRAIEQVPNDAEAHIALAEVLAHTNRGDDAIEEWNRAIDLLPGDTSPRMRAAQLARSLSLHSLARAYIDRILSDDAAFAPALLLRADIAFDENDRPSARQLYQAALAGHGEIDRAHVQRRLHEIDNPPRARRR